MRESEGGRKRERESGWSKRDSVRKGQSERTERESEEKGVKRERGSKRERKRGSKRVGESEREKDSDRKRIKEQEGRLKRLREKGLEVKMSSLVSELATRVRPQAIYLEVQNQSHDGRWREWVSWPSRCREEQ